MDVLSHIPRAAAKTFSGKAHPHDGPGQELIRAVHELSRQPQFEGKILLIEGYDLALARRLVTGVDVWLNTPRYPLEASGTSGMKAGINGVPHLSILDGWWPEAYDGRNGWGIAPQSASAPAEPHAHTEAQELLDILEYEVIPLYYDRNRQGYSPGWINKVKASMKSLIPRYGAERMVMDYVRKFYSRAALQQERLAADNFAAAIELAQWKQRVGECWPKVRLQLLDQPKPSVRTGEQLTFCAAVHLGGLAVEDVVMECLFGSERDNRYVAIETHRFTAKDTSAEGETRFEIELTPGFSGLQTYKLRLYPYHQLLTHRFETGLMKWI